jgi:transposase
MAKALLDDDLWTLIAPLLPARPPRRFKYPGRKPVDDRLALTGILFVLKSGIPWEMLPAEFGCCGMTCWRRLRDWQQAGVWEELHAVLLCELRRREELDLSRAVVDSSSVRAVFGGKKLDRTRRIAARPALSTMSSPMRKVFRWLAPSPAPTRMM